MALLLSETGSDASTNSLPRADSLIDEPGAFEGPEKTLEVCFLPGAGDVRGCRGLTRALGATPASPQRKRTRWLYDDSIHTRCMSADIK